MRGRLLLACVLGVLLHTRVMAADPVKDCPAGLVCYTVDENTKIAKERASLKRQIADLSAQVELANVVRKPKLFEPYWQAGGSYLSGPLGNTFGGYADIGLGIGPWSVSVGLHDYGPDSVGSHATVAYTAKF
jgi:hypothetical protein